MAVHGREDSTLAYYKSNATDYDTNTLIQSAWWENLAFGQNILYFHVCHGTNILRKGELQKLFPNWVSYNDEIAHTISGHDVVREKSESFMSQFNSFFQSADDTKTFYEQTKSLYKGMIEELNDHQGAYSIDVHMALLQNNLDCLDSSINI